MPVSNCRLQLLKVQVLELEMTVAELGAVIRMIELLYRLCVTWNETVKSVSESIIRLVKGVNDSRLMVPLLRLDDGMFRLSPVLVRVVAIKLVEAMLGSE